MALPGDTSATLSLGVAGAAWYPGKGSHTMTTDEPAVPRRAATTARLERDAAMRDRVTLGAAGLLAGPPPAGMVRVSLRGGGLLVVDEAGKKRRTIPLDAP
jgi:hypothetical protein